MITQLLFLAQQSNTITLGQQWFIALLMILVYAIFFVFVILSIKWGKSFLIKLFIFIPILLDIIMSYTLWLLSFKQGQEAAFKALSNIYGAFGLHGIAMTLLDMKVIIFFIIIISVLISKNIKQKKEIIALKGLKSQNASIDSIIEDEQ